MTRVLPRPADLSTPSGGTMRYWKSACELSIQCTVRINRLTIIEDFTQTHEKQSSIEGSPIFPFSGGMKGETGIS